MSLDEIIQANRLELTQSEKAELQTLLDEGDTETLNRKLRALKTLTESRRRYGY